MALRLNGATAGYVELNAPDSAASNTLTLPNGNGSSGQYLQTNGSGGLSWQTVAQGASWTETANTSLSGVSTSISGIPSNARRIVLMWDSASNNSNYATRIRVGSGGTIKTSGYSHTSGYLSGTSSQNTSPYTDYIEIAASGDTDVSGMIEFIRGNGNLYYGIGMANKTSNNNIWFSVTEVTLTGTMDEIQMFPSGGTGWTAGTMNLRYLTQD